MIKFIRDCISDVECKFCPCGVTCVNCIGTKARIWLDMQEENDESKTTHKVYRHHKVIIRG